MAILKENSKINKTTGLETIATIEDIDNKLIELGGGDMLKSVYDPNDRNKDIFNYNNLDNRPSIPSITGLASETYVNNKVKTDVPAGAIFTDTVTTVNGKTGVITKDDILALGIGESIPVTYAELNGLISSNSLVAQQRYIITDYQTVYTIPNTTEIKECDIEPLLVTAVTNNSLHPLAYSLIHTDDIIYYNIENNQEQVKGCTKGYISRRIDSRKNNDVGFDFRNVVFRRWQVTANEYNSGTTYAKNAVVKLGDNFYASCTAGNVGNLVTNKEFWIDLQLPDLQYVGHNSTGNVSQLKFVPTGEFLDYPMFIKYDTSEGIQENYFEQRRAGREWIPAEDLISSNNMVFFNDVIENNIFSVRNQNTTFFKPDNQPLNKYKVVNNKFNFICYHNLFNGGVFNNNIENHFRYNFISCPVTAEPSGNNGFRNNKIGIEFSYNIISPMVPSDTQFGWNEIGINYRNNYIHNYFGLNNISNSFNSNNISCTFGANSIIGMMQNNLMTGGVVSYTHCIAVFVNNIFTGDIKSSSTLGVVQGVTSNGDLSGVIFEGRNVNITLPNNGITGVVIGQGLSNKDYSLDTIATGSKLYNTIPLLPNLDPTTDNQAVRKKYIDDLVGDLADLLDTINGEII